VDTTGPEVHILSAERRGADVLVSWQVKEEHPDTSALRVEYRTADMPEGQWRPVGYVPGSPEQVSFPAAGAGEVLVRVQAVDLAGNRGEDTRTVAGGVPATATIVPASTVESVPLVGGGTNDGGRKPEGGLAGRPGSNPATGTGLVFDSVPASAPASTPPAMAQSGVVGPPPSPVGQAGPAYPPAPGFPGGGSPPPAMPPGTAGPLNGVQRGSLPPFQVVNKRQVKLDFEVKAGPSGVGAVEVYATTDEGTTWDPMPVSPDAVVLPVGDGGRAGTGSVTVSLAREGVVYGFYIVVKNRAGIGKPPPHRGDPPQVRVELDTMLPLAKLYAPAQDPARPNALILAWTASDRNLAASAIVLEWAERKEGSWVPISPEPLANNLPEQAASGLDRQNVPTGSYSWQIPDRMPPKVYLRLSVRDTAGNVAVAETREPVIIDLFQPDIEMVTVHPGPR
jgi:hypothetical protein